MPLLVVGCAPAEYARGPGLTLAATSNSGPWLQFADVRQAGYDPGALQSVCERADTLRSGALMAVVAGRAIIACGDVSRSFEAHSVRKSLLSGLYGTAIARGEIDLDSTLSDFSIDDETSLTAAERSATIRHVISARSGVYLPAAYGASQDRRRPARGSHAPGTRWFYNNWDYNVAGVIYERATREDLYESFYRRLARPLGMEDWKHGDGFRVYEPTKSRHPAHTFRISARDLARFGQLYLQRGQWDGRQIFSAEWVSESTRPHTDDGDGTGYGYMWWTYQRGSEFIVRNYPALSEHTFYRALGTGEQALTVIPALDLVVVHRADTDHARRVDGENQWRLVEAIVAARRSEPASQPELRAMQPTALSSQLPPAAIPEPLPVDAGSLKGHLGDYSLARDSTALGEYELSEDGAVRVYLFEEKPFVHLPGVGDVQIFATGQRDTFNVRILPGLRVAFERGPDDTPAAIALTFGNDKISASRLK
jgi:CubicO group peptidase (beta-lactamase class C family)